MIIGIPQALYGPPCPACAPSTASPGGGLGLSPHFTGGACLLLALVPGAAPLACAAVGLFIAPVFPTGLPWLNRALPHARRAGAWVIVASMIGGVAGPPLLGKGMETSGMRAVLPVLLTALSAASLLATLAIGRSTRNARAGAARPSRSGVEGHPGG